MNSRQQEKLNEGRFVNHKGSALFYAIIGEGLKTMIAFHGYGQDHNHFRSFSLALQNQYKIISVDLFFHGQSTWGLKDEPLSKEDWLVFMNKIIDQERLTKFSLAGFSMGGKFLLATLEAFPEKVDEIIFIAPDGIKLNIWYNLATSQKGLRNYFKSIIRKPKRFSRLVHLMQKVNVINKRVLKFASSQMNTLRKRYKVYLSWVVFRDLKFETKKIAGIINKNQIKATFYLGKYDKIVTKDQMWGLLKRLKEYELKILDSGHSHLIEAVAKDLKNNRG